MSRPAPFPAPRLRCSPAEHVRRAAPANLLLLLFVLLLLTSIGNAATGSGTRAPGGAWESPIQLPSLPASAAGADAVEAEVTQVRARLLVDHSGDRLRAGVLFDLGPGWHLYWRNPGGTGLAPQIELNAAGHRAGEIDWPAPRTFEEADGLFTTWGYEDFVLLSAPLEPTSGERRHGVVAANVRALACRTQCVPVEFALSIAIDHTLPPSEAAVVANLFRAERGRVPTPIARLGFEADARWRDGAPPNDGEGIVELGIRVCTDAREACPTLWTSGGEALFVPMEQDVFEFEPARPSTTTAQGFALEIPTTRLDDGEDRLRGLVPLRAADGGLVHVEVDVAILSTQPVVAAGDAAEHARDAAAVARTPAPPAPPATPEAAIDGATANAGPAPAPEQGGLDWLHVLGLALLGGLILNGMPCVLPVLAIKVVSIADLAEKDPREVRLHGLAYTGGVLASMFALAAVVVGLRSAGHAVGWGFQFQEPIFVAAIAAVLVTFALNLFGVFEIELGQGRLATVGQDATGLRRSAFEGLLAVVLATPCTAPFLGTAVGFAFASHAAIIVVIFLAIGLGLASPFLMVSFRPSMARFIPRSGPWMNTLRAGLGFSLLATVVWLLWVLGQSGGADAVVSTTAVLLALAFVLWIFGRLQPMSNVWLGRASVIAIAGLATVGFNLIELDRAGTDPTESLVVDGDPGWQVYSEDAVAETLAEGRPAFVVFTADWCITCKMNERTVLEREAVRAAYAEHGYALFQADWTRRDDGIRRKLAEFGRAGVPLYLVYTPAAPDAPRVLSELLSVDEVVTALASSAATPAG